MPSRTSSRPSAPRRQQPRTSAADKSALDALRRSEARYRALAETTTDFIWEIDASGRYTYCSPQMEALWGIRPSDMIGRTPFDVMPADDRPNAIAFFQEVARDPRPFNRLQSSAHDAAGRVTHLETSGVPFFADDGTLLGFRGITRDITEQKRLESEAQKLLGAVREEKERLAALVSSIQDEVWFVDASRKLTLLNASVRRQSRPLDHAFDAGDVAQSYEVLRRDGSPRPPDEAPPLRALKGETLDCVEEIVRTPGSGELRYREVTASPVRDAAGDIVGSVSIVRDVTRRKRAEEALRTSNERFENVLRHLDDDFAVFDSQYRYVYMNEAVTRHLGVPRDTLLGKTLWELFPQLTAAAAHLQAVIGDRQPRTWTEQSPLTGRWLEWRAFPWEEGIATLVRDITARKQAEDALRESERSLAEADRQRTDILESISDCFYALDEDLRFTYVNRAAEEIWHLSRADLIGRRIDEVFEGLIDISLSKFREVAAEHVPQHYEVYSNVVQRWGEMSVYPTHNGVSVYFNDITERKRAEEALSEANARLAKADRRKDEFLAMLAHELRNPLSVLGGACEILQRAGDVEPEVRRAQDAIQRQARHMARLVDDLLDVSRVTQGKIGLKDERVPVADVLGRAVEATTPMIRALGHRLFVALPAEPLSIRGDPVRLTQILANLLNNAAKYTPAGGEIHLSAERRGVDVEIRVRDNGQGIDATLLPHVFDLFVQGERGSDRTLGGLGIGLTMARSLVEMHGGTIDAHSDGPGTGSEFVIVLPLAQAEAEPGIETRRCEHTGSRRILVVDDNPDAAEMMRTLLELDGNEVRAVQDGPAAIQCALAWRPDVALIDLGMPGMDGFEVARRFRAEPSLQDTVLVAVTGYGQEDDLRRSREAGFHHHVTKSADFEPLRRVLDSIAPAPES